MECIAVINQKGGVGKTSTAVNLGAALGHRGQRMLLIDLDPQGHLTAHFGLESQANGASIYEVLAQNLDARAAMHTISPMLTVIPSNIDLAGAEVELVGVVGRERILKDALDVHAQAFDMVMIDCPPSLGILTLNALGVATQVLIPLQPHFLALQGVSRLLETTALVSHRINPALKVAGVVICMNEPGTRLSTEVIDDLSSFLESSRSNKVPWRNARVFESRVRRNVKLAEAPSYGQTIFDYAPRSNGAFDYLALADEFLCVIGGSCERSAPTPIDAVPRPVETVVEVAATPVETAAPPVEITAPPRRILAPAIERSAGPAKATRRPKTPRLNPAEAGQITS